MQTAELITNESYWDFYTKKQFNKTSFLIPSISSITDVNLTSKEYIRNLCLLMQEKDLEKETKYAIEVLPNGRSRPGRIPAVRFNQRSQTIWKVAKTLKSVERSINDLEENIYFLKESREDQSKPLPFKVLLCSFGEEQYVGHNKNNSFVRRVVNESGIIWLSSYYLWNIWTNPNLEYFFDFDKILKEEARLFLQRKL